MTRYRCIAGQIIVLSLAAAAPAVLAQESATPAMSVCQARQAIVMALQRLVPSSIEEIFDSQPSEIAFDTGQLEFTASPHDFKNKFPPGIFKVDLKTLGEVTAHLQSSGVWCDIQIDGRDPSGAWNGRQNRSSASILGFLLWYSQSDSGAEAYRNCQAFANGMNTLRLYARTDDVSRDLAPSCLADREELRRRQDQRERIFTAFQQRAAAWRALPARPALSEAVRKQQLLAEDAVNQKQFEAAAAAYDATTEIDPTWPEGHFNAAALYGELKDYDDAIWHMRCYLELMPNAPDAQTARDQMLLWEAKLEQQATAK